MAKTYKLLLFKGRNGIGEILNVAGAVGGQRIVAVAPGGSVIAAGNDVMQGISDDRIAWFERSGNGVINSTGRIKQDDPADHSLEDFAGFVEQV